MSTTTTTETTVPEVSDDDLVDALLESAMAETRKLIAEGWVGMAIFKLRRVAFPLCQIAGERFEYSAGYRESLAAAGWGQP